MAIIPVANWGTKAATTPEVSWTSMTVPAPPLHNPELLAANVARHIADYEHFTSSSVDTIEVPDEATAARIREALPAGSEVTVKVRP